MNIFWWICLTIYVVILIVYVRRILLDITEPPKTVAWLLVVLFLPVIGISIYRIIGRNIRKERFFKKRLQDRPEYLQKIGLVKMQTLQFIDAIQKNIRLIQLLEENTHTHIRIGNRVEVLQNGKKTFDNMFAALKKAKHHIHMDFYIIEAGKLTDDLIPILKDRNDHGVTIRIVYDHVGSWGLDRKLITAFRKAGVDLRVFMPLKPGKISKRLNYRNHRKIVVIDNNIGYTGGMNLSDKYIYGDSDLGFWRDTFIKIEGPGVVDLQRIFLQDWYLAKGKILKSELPLPQSYTENTPVQIVYAGPDSTFSSIMHQYFTIITDADKYVYISTPYFIPGKAIMVALCTSALSGVDVRMLLPFNSDSRWLKWSMMTFLQELLDAGVKIYLFREGFMHSKVIIADDNLVSVGTANMDERSFDSNFEVNVMIYDESTCLELKTDFFNDIKKSEELHKETFGDMEYRNQTMESFARLTSPLL